ncbi:MAG: glycerophosphodiester phosphodiesterase [Acidimicrobiales bacterium]
MEALIRPPITFAHRGARAHAPENTLPAFELALRLGASGLESDVWLSADGVPVLDHDGVVRQGLRRRRISQFRFDELPEWVPSLGQLYATCGTNFELSLDVKDPAAAGAVIAEAKAAGPEAEAKLWLCHPSWETVAGWRDLSDRVRLVDSTRIGRIKEGPERRAATLAEVGINAINMHANDWTGGLTTLFHRFELVCLGWDAQHERVLMELLVMGVDGVFSDHVDRMMEVLGRFNR